VTTHLRKYARMKSINQIALAFAFSPLIGASVLHDDRPSDHVNLDAPLSADNKDTAE